MRYLKIAFLASSILIFFQNCSKEVATPAPVGEIWTKEKANDWYKPLKWLVGADYIPATAINELEMWQANTFDTTTIEKEFLLAENLGMNTMRVFLHDQLYQQDSIGFYSRINTFLKIAARHGIRPMFVLFDSCWDPFPSLGKQRDPKPFVHNSGWVQSPGQLALKDSSQYLRLERYVKGVVGNFNSDSRILAWDIWNEPDNMTGSSYQNIELPNKIDYVLPLLKKSFDWARSVNPTQPLTSAVWIGDWSSDAAMRPIEILQVDRSDVVTFHNYGNPRDLEKRILDLQRFGRPVICTEY
ncbi:MAG: cellulase family glycosylhydrolase, partial [Bacteroidota bacterium]|nr:cellulase family glycosylhydrolase [Bacteroidota bacterium]